MRVLRPIRHEDRLSVIDHLDELRSRIIVCLVAFAVVFCAGFWQNHPLINTLNRALPPAAKTGLESQSKTDTVIGNGLSGAKRALDGASSSLAKTKSVSPAVAKDLKAAATDLGQAAKQIPATVSTASKPVTFGVGESFTTTLLVVAYFALLITLPLILYEVYAFVIPALSRNERRIAVPSMLAAPALFLAGAVFTYFAILPPAIHFLQGYNSTEFQVFLQAKTYYKFEILMMMGIGLAFQVPLLLLALQKVGVVTAKTLTINWRYATVLIAIIAAALPGVDPVTMTLETLPLVFLYLLSIFLLTAVERRARRRETAEAARAAAGTDLGAA